jgi:membrane protein implicated in regulation of membrane protease activity
VNLNGEILTLSRHLMLFLIAVFAFASKSLLDSHDFWVQVIFTVALLLGVASFMAGYATIFSILNEEGQYPRRDDKTRKLTTTVLKRIKAQYSTTILALLLAVAALIRLLAIPKAG